MNMLPMKINLCISAYRNVNTAHFIGLHRSPNIDASAAEINNQATLC